MAKAKRVRQVKVSDARMIQAFKAAGSHVQTAASALGMGLSTIYRRLGALGVVLPRVAKRKAAAASGKKVPAEKGSVASVKKSPAKKKAAASVKKSPAKKSAAASVKKAPAKKKAAKKTGGR